jgi:heme exporter protein D
MDLGPHAIFIWLCYGVAAVVVLALVIWLWLDGRRRQQELSLLVAQGIGRGAQGRPDSPKRTN